LQKNNPHNKQRVCIFGQTVQNAQNNRLLGQALFLRKVLLIKTKKRMMNKTDRSQRIVTQTKKFFVTQIRPERNRET
jgi:hypothetical protein